MVVEKVSARSKGATSWLLIGIGLLLLLIAGVNVFNIDRQSNLVLVLLGLTGTILLAFGIRSRR